MATSRRGEDPGGIVDRFPTGDRGAAEILATGTLDHEVEPSELALQVMVMSTCGPIHGVERTVPDPARTRHVTQLPSVVAEVDLDPRGEFIPSAEHPLQRLSVQRRRTERGPPNASCLVVEFEDDLEEIVVLRPVTPSPEQAAQETLGPLRAEPDRCMSAPARIVLVQEEDGVHARRDPHARPRGPVDELYGELEDVVGTERRREDSGESIRGVTQRHGREPLVLDEDTAQEASIVTPLLHE